MNNRRFLVPFTILLAALSMAPTPGDIGGCGQPAETLENQDLFFRAMQSADCSACKRCGISTKSCKEACEGLKGLPPRFPDGCVPLVHDGEVCLRKLQEEECDSYKLYMVDDERGDTIPVASRPRPTECQFCPERP